MNMGRIDFSVIVPAYNEELLLPATLRALKLAIRESNYNGELIVVDNNSTDNTARIANEFGAKVVFEDKKQIACARNAGAANAKGQFLFFADADTLVPPEIFKMILLPMKSGKLCGGGVIPEFMEKYGFFFNASMAFWQLISKSFSVAAGCFIFAEKVAFEKVGGFSEYLYASEEIDLSKKLKSYARKNGKAFKVFVSPKVRTSARKSEMPGKILLTAIIFALFPMAVRFKGLCFLWYDCGRD
jgi:glycosyltransferase involved in cell wall biosynthesis